MSDLDAELLAALVQLVACVSWEHTENCGRTQCCDDAAEYGRPCRLHLSGCWPCNCNVLERRARIAAARALIAKATEGE
jgi:hypothetical protein